MHTHLPHTFGLSHIVINQNPIKYLKQKDVNIYVKVVDDMTDTVQAKRDLEYCSAELSKYQDLSRSGLRHSELIAIDNVMIRLKERIKNLTGVLLGNI